MMIDIDKTALIVVDVQNAFCSEKGYFAREYGFDISPMQDIVPDLEGFISEYKEKGGLVIYTQHIDEGLPENVAKLYDSGVQDPMCERGTFDAELYKVEPKGDDVLLSKHTLSAFSNPELEQILEEKGIENLIMTGVCTGACVNDTMASGFERGYNIIVSKDLVATDGREWRQKLHDILLNYQWPILKGQVVLDSKEILEALN